MPNNQGGNLEPSGSDFQQAVQQYRAEGRYVSSGQFSLDRQWAKQKLSAYLLPRPDAWVLKVLQFLDLQTASYCQVQISARKITIVSEFKELIQSDAFASSLANEIAVSEQKTEELKLALWSAAISCGAPFLLRFPGAASRLRWDGQTLRIESAEPQGQFELILDHPPTRPPAEVRAGLAYELAAHAFAYPRPITLDARRLDALQLNPDHGCFPGKYPLQLRFLCCDGPPLGIPAYTLEGYSRPLEHNLSLNDIHKFLVSKFELIRPVAPFQGVLYLTAHLKRRWTTQGFTWSSMAAQSQISWIKSGVVIEKEPLPWKPRSISVNLLLSADDLRTDLSGFQLLKGPEKSARVVSALKGAAPTIGTVNLNFEAQLRNHQRQQTEDAKVLACMSVVPTLLFPPTLLLTAAGLIACKLACDAAGSSFGRIESDLNEIAVALSEGLR